MGAGIRAPLVAGVLAALLMAPASARAEDASALVLGVRSLEGDDALARHTTEALTLHASNMDGWSVGDRRVSLAQMMLVHDCDESDARCMAGVAQSLDVDRLIYGTLRRTGAGDRYDFSLGLHLFDRHTGQIERGLTVELPREEAADHVTAHAPRWVGQLAGRPASGALRVSVNVPGAEVRVDGNAVGAAGETGVIQTDMQAGAHRVEVAAEGYGTFRSTVEVAAHRETSLEVELEERASASPEAPAAPPPEERVVYGTRVTWPTYVAFVGSALSAAVSIYAFVRVGNLHTDDRVLQWGDPGGSFDDACGRASAASGSMAEANEAVDLCDQAYRLEPVRWVFLALAVATGGTGAFLLWRDLDASSTDDDGEADRRSGIRLGGGVGPRGGRLTASWQF